MRLKQLLSFLICAFFCLTTQAFAVPSNIDIRNYSSEKKGIVSVHFNVKFPSAYSGDLAIRIMKKSDKNTAVTEANAKDMVIYLSDYTVSEALNTELIVPFGKAQSSGDYALILTMDGRQIIYDFFYISQAEMNAVCDRINQAQTPEEVEAYFAGDTAILKAAGFIIDAYLLSEVNQDEIAKALYDKKEAVPFSSISELNTAFNEAVVTALLNAQQTVVGIIGIADEFPNILSLNLTSNQDYNSILDKSGADLLMENLLAQKPFENLEEFKADLSNAISATWQNISHNIVLAEINAADYTNIKSVLAKYAADLALDLEEIYGKIKSKISQTDFEREVAGISFSRFEDVQQTVVTVAKKYYSDENGGTSESSSGTKHTSSGGTAVRSPAVDPLELQPSPEVENSGEAPVQFTDLQEVSWAEVAINYLASHGVIQGNGGATFLPSENVTREQFVKMLSLAFEIEITSVQQNSFDDIDHAAWYAPYIAAAKSHGLVKGVDDRNFGIGRPITKQEIAVMAKNFAAYTGLELKAEHPQAFADDQEIAPWAQEAVYALRGSGVINGEENGNSFYFYPESTATRAQAAQIIYGLLQQREGGTI